MYFSLGWRYANKSPLKLNTSHSRGQQGVTPLFMNTKQALLSVSTWRTALIIHHIIMSTNVMTLSMVVIVVSEQLTGSALRSHRVDKCDICKI